MHLARVESPIGTLTLVSEDGLSLSGLYSEGNRFTQKLRGHEDFELPLFRTVAAQLAEYFNGKSVTFDVPVSLSGSLLDLEVWQELRLVGFGEGINLADFARRIRRPQSLKEVAAAIYRNPVAVIVPSHRILGLPVSQYSDPAVTKLLAIEGIPAPQPELSLA